jgi:anion-transporting  ArsA/GET3 family ATPase
VQAFVRRLEGMYAGFADRAAQVQQLIREPTSALVLVATAEPQRVAQTREFISSLERLGLCPGALIINRLMPPLPGVEEIQRARLPAALKRKLERNLADFSALQAREAAWLEQLREMTPKHVPILIAEDLGGEPETLGELVRIARSLRVAG